VYSSIKKTGKYVASEDNTILWWHIPYSFKLRWWTQSGDESFWLLTRPVTSLEHQGCRRVFWEELKFFKLCPIVFNDAQQIFARGAEKFRSGRNPPAPPLFTGLLLTHVKCFFAISRKPAFIWGGCEWQRLGVMGLPLSACSD